MLLKSAVLVKSAALVLRTVQYRHAGEWAKKNRRLSRSESSEPGEFNTERTPYFIPVHEACESGKYRRVVVVCGSQMAKSEFMLNRVGYRLDTKPCPILIAQPNKDLAKRFSKSRVSKLLQNTPPLWQKLAKGKLDNIFEKYIGGCQLKIAWATSATQLCSDPAGEAHLDELDRMPDDVEGEGDPVLLAEVRGSTYPDFLLCIYSTPTIEGKSKIMREFSAGTEQVFCAPCPHCGHYFAPFFVDLWYPKDCTSGQAKKEARVICPECKQKIDDSWRIEANKPGVGLYLGPGQRVENGKVVGELKDTSIASFRIPGLFSPWVSFGESAALWIEAESSGDAEKVKTIINTRFGDLYRLEGDRPQEEEMEVLKADPESPKLPAWSLLLTAGVDVQKRGLYVAVRAWGPAGKSHLALFAFLPGDTNEDRVWKDLEDKILDFPFETMERNPRKLFIVKMGIDRRYREEMVDVFVSKHKDKCVGVLGQFRQVAPCKLTRIEVTYEGRPKLTGIQVLSIGDTHFKLAVFNKITRGPDVEDAWLIAKDATQEYCDQVLSEELVSLPSGRTIWVKKRNDNHALDAEKIVLALAHWLNFRLLKEQSETPSRPQRQVRQAQEFQEA